MYFVTDMNCFFFFFNKKIVRKCLQLFTNFTLCTAEADFEVQVFFLNLKVGKSFELVLSYISPFLPPAFTLYNYAFSKQVNNALNKDECFKIHSILILQFSSIYWTKCRHIPNSFLIQVVMLCLLLLKRGGEQPVNQFPQIHQVDDLSVNWLFFIERLIIYIFFNLQKKKPTDNRLNSPWRSQFKTSRL